MAERKNVAKKVYVYKDGTEHRSASPDVERLEFRFANDYVMAVTAADVGDDCKVAALWHGIAQKIGDTYARAKGEVDEAIMLAEAMVERLKEGVWVAEGEGPGVRITMLVTAVSNALEAAGRTAEEATIIARLTGDTPEASKALRDGAMAQPAIKAAYMSLKAEAAAARAAKAVESVGEATIEGF